jgi:polyribonucleotide nucleotidyltransferase
VKSIQIFGAFVEILPGKEGLLHVSEINWDHIKNVEDVLQVGDPIQVKLLAIEDNGKLRLSRKVLLPKPEGYVERERPERKPNPERRIGNDRRSRDRDRGRGGSRGRGGRGGNSSSLFSDK